MHSNQTLNLFVLFFSLLYDVTASLNVKPVDPTHKRKDYTEVHATAPKNYICDMCGKSFQSRDDLVHHQEFEFKDKE
jgi:hypothetical protein